VPFLSDGIEIFESGAGLLPVPQGDRLMPRDPVGSDDTAMIAALNSIEMVTVPWWF
jgi:glutathione S-transferase